MTATLSQTIANLDTEMQGMANQMIADGMPATAIAFLLKVLQPGYEMLIRAKHDNVPVGDVDEAIVFVISSLTFQYLKMIHPKIARKEAFDHFEMIGLDVSERVQAMLDKEFVQGFIKEVSKLDG